MPYAVWTDTRSECTGTGAWLLPYAFDEAAIDNMVREMRRMTEAKARYAKEL